MAWQRGRTIMADLQDTNAATEEIYGPLLIVDCPVTDEMISQSSGRMAASTRESSFSCPSTLFINQMFWVEATSRSARRKQHAGRKHDKDWQKQVWEGEWNCQGESGAWFTGEKLDDIYVICKSYFEEIITFNNLEGQWSLDTNLIKISSPVTWNHLAPKHCILIWVCQRMEK